MKLTVDQVFNATTILTQIINEKRPLPLKGAYRVARMHAKLAPEFQTIAQRRDALVLAYDYHEMVWDETGGNGRPSGQFSVPADKIDEFLANWGEIASEEIDVGVEPIPLSQIDLGDDVPGQITASELIGLGDLVIDDTAEPAAKAA